MHRAIGTGLAGVGVTIVSTFAPSLGLSLHQQRIGFAIGVLLMLAGIGIFAVSFLAGRGKGRGSAIGTLDPRYEALSDLLGRSITVALRLSEDEDEDWPLRDAWEAHTRLLIESAYGSGEGAHVFTPDLSEPRVFAGLDIRNAPRPLAAPIERLRELLGRMPSLTMRSTFRPEGWGAFDPDAYRAEHALRIREIDGSALCPWCGKKIGEHASSCDACGAERGGDFLYRKSSDEPPAYARLLRLPLVDDTAVLADLFKEGDDLRSACTKAPDGSLAQKAHWRITGGTPQEQCAREDQARDWDRRVAEFLWSKTSLKRFGPGWKPAGAPIEKAADHPAQAKKSPRQLAEWYQGKLDYLRSVIEAEPVAGEKTLSS